MASLYGPIGVADDNQKVVYVIRYSDGTYLGEKNSRVMRQSAMKFESHESAEKRAVAISKVRSWIPTLGDFEVEEYVRRTSQKKRRKYGSTE